MQIDQDLNAALYVLGFNFLDGDLVSGEIAEIKAITQLLFPSSLTAAQFRHDAREAFRQPASADPSVLRRSSLIDLPLAW
jgi:hypothetical protein